MKPRRAAWPAASNSYRRRQVTPASPATTIQSPAAPSSGRQQTYKWDAENRLSKIDPLGTPQAGDKAIAFKYDYLGRRVQAEVSTFGGSSWTVFRDAAVRVV